MQPTLQPSQPTQSVDPQSDPHDAIVALMRGNASAPRWSDPSELNFTPVDDANAATTNAATCPHRRSSPRWRFHRRR